MKAFLSVLIVFMGLGFPPALAQPLGPVVPKATGNPHPEGNLYWRINHPRLLKHDRNLTVRLGDRNIGASMKACVACHASTDANGEPIRINADKQFCSVCHEYAAVKIDCFECHATVPDKKTEAFLMPRTPDENQLAAYLKETSE
jgi:hypothetical protein